MRFFLLLISLLFLSCKADNGGTSSPSSEPENIEIEFAKGFTIEKYDGYSLLLVKDPWPKADRTYRYLLVETEEKIPTHIEYDQKVHVPIKKTIVTSTTHIPSLEILDSEDNLIGFPGLDYVSSEKVRKLIDKGEVTEIGRNEAINTEVLISLEPQVVIGFAVNGNNRTYNTIEKSGIPVLFNGDWTEESPLGKAEWIKFFGALLDKSEEAEEFFDKVVSNYNAAKTLAKTASSTPTVMSGSMYKDQWYVPYGNSWQARFLEDANSDYIYKNTEGSGSIALAFETVLSEAEDADFWVAPGQFTSFKQLLETSSHYKRFNAVREQNVYTYSNSTGATGGVLYYELAPTRPDLVLKDLISIFHPDLLPDHETTFYKPLD